MRMVGFDVSHLMLEENNISLVPFIAYCMHKFACNLEGEPSICTIHNANLLLKDSYFSPILPKWLDHITANNALAMLICDAEHDFEGNIAAVNEKFATHLFLPHPDPEIYQKALQLTEEELDEIKHMKLIYRNFMIKHWEERIVVELNLDGMDYTIKALAGKQDAIEAMEQAIASNGDNPNSWIISFYKNLFPQLHIEK